MVSGLSKRARELMRRLTVGPASEQILPEYKRSLLSAKNTVDYPFRNEYRETSRIKLHLKYMKHSHIFHSFQTPASVFTILSTVQLQHQLVYLQYHLQHSYNTKLVYLQYHLGFFPDLRGYSFDIRGWCVPAVH